MSFDTDTSNPYLKTAADLKARFAVDAVERDKLGGQPLEQLGWLKQSGLLNLLIPTQDGGLGQPWSTALRIVREFAKVDGSLAHLYGYHFMAMHNVALRGTTAQRRDLFQRSASGNWFWGNSVNTFSHSLFGKKTAEGYVLNGRRPFSSGSHIADFLSVAWEDESTDQRFYAAIPANREGVTINHDWNGIGQRQTGSGSVNFSNVRIGDIEVFDPREVQGTPFNTLGSAIPQLVLLNVFVGTAQGALEAARDYTVNQSRAWVTSGLERAIDDPWVKRVYGELFLQTQAATELAERALESFDTTWQRGLDLDEAQRGRNAIKVATANVFAGDTALNVTSKLFEVMGARSATTAHGFDRFWRNVRTHTLHNPAEYKTRNVGHWYLTGEFPVPHIYQ